MKVTQIIVCTLSISFIGSGAPRAEDLYQGTAAEDGDAAAQLGIRVYNFLNPNTPLPVSRGNAVNETAKYMGHGESPANTFSHAADDNAQGK